jgi:hypothetical protein
MKRKPYFNEINPTGISVANVDFICKNWNDKFSIITWINEKEEKYIFCVHGRGKESIIVKSQISKEQAFEIVKELDLFHVKNTLFRSAGIYRTKEFIISEINRIEEIRTNKSLELRAIETELFNFEDTLSAKK